MSGMQQLNVARDRARYAAQAHRDAQRAVDDAERDMYAAYDSLFDELATVLTETPVEFLAAVDVEDLSQTLQLVRWVEFQRIFHGDTAPEDLPGASDLYCYRYPGATTRLWEAFRAAADTLGFFPRMTYSIYTKTRRGVDYNMIRNMFITDQERTTTHEQQFTKLLEALSLHQDGIELIRVISEYDEVAERVNTGSGTEQWYVYKDTLSVFRASEFVEVRDGSENPLDFLQSSAPQE